VNVNVEREIEDPAQRIEDSAKAIVAAAVAASYRVSGRFECAAEVSSE